jgi:hypothetical protein
MQVYTEILPETKSSKHTGIRWTPSGTTPAAGLLVIQSKRTHCEYLVVETPGRYPVRSFLFAKSDATPGSDGAESSYTVSVGVAGSPCSCTCRGFLRHGHCKHVEAAVAILDNGWMRTDLVNPEADAASAEAPF